MVCFRYITVNTLRREGNNNNNNNNNNHYLQNIRNIPDNILHYLDTLQNAI